MTYNVGQGNWIGSSRPEIPEDLEETTRTAWARDIGKTERGYLLHGPAGTGKTTLMAITAANIAQPNGGTVSERTRFSWKDKRVLWTQSAEFCRDTKREIDLSKRFTDFDDNYSATGLAIYTPCLFLDDLGVEMATDYNAETICTLIDARYRSKKSTWITTNLTEKEISERYGERTLSRLMELLVLVEVSGNDRREVIQKQIADDTRKQITEMRKNNQERDNQDEAA